MNKKKHRNTVLYLSHGGGPMPLFADEAHKELIETLQKVTSIIKKPSAIIVISAHWEESIATITQNDSPDLIYDYSGFPEQAYNINYPVKGSPYLTEKILLSLNNKKLNAELNNKRGFDHGVFVPLKIMYPDADIPCVQLSLVNSLDPKTHIRIGEALGALEQDNILIIGSGFSFHNMKAFFDPVTTESQYKNELFESWLINTCSNKALNEMERADLFNKWENAPCARYCHPREEHLLPLHVCYGATKSACSHVFELTILNKKSSMYLWYYE
ncbi:MAG: dioxygenase [Gammaproteobacteria bacterium]|jgi:aromatic ring-opening dioxygenase catalytic subunit (LigB family)|nr:MAG: dioxygenase [Gammaproteobacteria bacterium]PHR84445.1 MAG: dioxygenase [Colwellia sp.]